MRNRLLKSFALFALLATVFVSCSNNNSNCNVVDLGLPSGVKWATCNLGAANPWDYGNYYAWGETQTKVDYCWKTYKYCKGTHNTLTKYCFDAKYDHNDYGYNGFTDDLTTLEAADDAATAVLGAGWAMPTYAEWKELGNQCYWVWTDNYKDLNIGGYIVYKAKADSHKGAIVYGEDTPAAAYSLADAHIFLPAAGYCNGTDLDHAGSCGCYWSTSLLEDGPHIARYCYFSSSSVNPSNYDGRRSGFSVRPVRRK